MAKLVWPNVLDAVKQLLATPRTPAAAFVAAHETAMQRLSKANTQLSRALWKQVILEQKMALKLAQLCCVDGSNHTASAVAAAALVALITQAITDGIIGRSAPQGGRFPTALQQQIQASGLLMRLPGTLRRVCSSFSESESGGASSSRSSSASAAAATSGSSSSSTTTPSRSGLLRHAGDLLQLFFIMDVVWPGPDFVNLVAAHSGAAAVELALAVFAFVDRCLKQDGSRDTGAPMLFQHALVFATATLQVVIPRLSKAGALPPPSSELPSADTQLMSWQAPSFVPAAGLLLAILGYHLLLRQHGSKLPGLFDSSSDDGGGSSGSSGGGGSNSNASISTSSSNHASASNTSASTTSTSNATRSTQSGSSSSSSQVPLDLDAAAMLLHVSPSAPRGNKLWRAACQQSRRLPPTHKRVFELLGFDARLLMWTAHIMPDSDLLIFVQAADVFSNFLDAAASEGQSVAGLSPLLHSHQLQQLASIGSHLLYFSSHHKFTNMTGLGGHASSLVNSACNQILYGHLRLLPAPQQQRGAGSSDSQQQQQQGTGSSGSGGQQLLPVTPVMVVQHTLALMSTVLPRLLAAMNQRSSQACTDDGDAAVDTGGSSSSSRATSTSRAERIACLERQLAVLLEACKGVPFQNLILVGSSTSTGASASQGVSAATNAHASTSALADVAAEWRLHAVHLTPQLEAYVRLAAAEAQSPSAARSSSDEVQHVNKKIVRMGLQVLFTAGSDNPHDWGPLLAAAISAGCGSNEQRALVGLMCSLLKLHAAVMRSATPQQVSQQRYGEDSTSSPHLAAAWSATTLVEAAAAPAAAAPSHQHVLPWLNIFGRCCLQLSEHMHVHMQQQKIVAAMMGLHMPADSVLLHMQAAFQSYLRLPGVSDGLAATGYDVEPVTQQFAAAVAALQAAWQSPVVASTLREQQQLQSEVQRLGTACCALAAVPQLCNNPACSSVAGASEAQLVSGKGCVCGGCLTARYCNRDSCQRPHWRQHKPICKALAAAAAAAAAAEATAEAGDV